MKGRRPCLASKEEEGGGDRDLAFALTLSPLTDEEKGVGRGRRAGGRARALPPPSAPSSSRGRFLRRATTSADLNKAGDIHILLPDVAHVAVIFIVFYQ